jgi:hypothetical protein
MSVIVTGDYNGYLGFLVLLRHVIANYSTGIALILNFIV